MAMRRLGIVLGVAMGYKDKARTGGLRKRSLHTKRFEGGLQPPSSTESLAFWKAKAFEEPQSLEIKTKRVGVPLWRPQLADPKIPRQLTRLVPPAYCPPPLV
jgi:hypothetical protein